MIFFKLFPVENKSVKNLVVQNYTTQGKISENGNKIGMAVKIYINIEKYM